MRLSSHKIERESSIELSMTSMIDVVFLLLIFFMVTSSFVKTERELDSAIKVNRQAAGESPSDFEPAIIEVVKSGGRSVFRLGAREFTTQKELVAVLRQFENKADGAFVRVSDDVDFAMAAAAIQACKTARFLTVSYVPLESNPCSTSATDRNGPNCGNVAHRFGQPLSAGGFCTGCREARAISCSVGPGRLASPATRTDVAFHPPVERSTENSSPAGRSVCCPIDGELGRQGAL